VKRIKLVYTGIFLKLAIFKANLVYIFLQIIFLVTGFCILIELWWRCAPPKAVDAPFIFGNAIWLL